MPKRNPTKANANLATPPKRPQAATMRPSRNDRARVGLCGKATEASSSRAIVVLGMKLAGFVAATNVRPPIMRAGAPQ
jgi:hypothetical protein